MDLIRSREDQSGHKLQFAGFGLRLGAYLIDTLLYFFLLIVLVLSSLLAFDFEDPSENMKAAMGFTFIFYYYVLLPIVWLLYFALFEASKYQGTLGKLAVGIKVTDNEGERISFWRSMGRNASKFLSTMIFFVGYLMILWTRKKQGLHDLIVESLVVRK